MNGPAQVRTGATVESVRPEVAFCLWALRRDGLKASPFDQHSDGDGQLRAAGLDADSWKRWLRAVVGAQERFAQGIGDGSASKDSLGLRRLGRAAADPVRFAPPKARRVLRDWWLEYRDEGAAWRRSARPGLIASLDRSDQRAFVARLDEFRPAPLLGPVPPAHCLAGSARNDCPRHTTDRPRERQARAGSHHGDGTGNPRHLTSCRRHGRRYCLRFLRIVW